MYIARGKPEIKKMRSILTFSLLFFVTIASFGQSDRLNIYVDCQMRCDRTYMREQIKYVNYMQDRFEADVYILATRQRTGSGGDEIQILFTGNKSFAGEIDTIVYQLDADATNSISRSAFVKNLGIETPNLIGMLNFTSLLALEATSFYTQYCHLQK